MEEEEIPIDRIPKVAKRGLQELASDRRLGERGGKHGSRRHGSHVQLACLGVLGNPDCRCFTGVYEEYRVGQTSDVCLFQTSARKILSGNRTRDIETT